MRKIDLTNFIVATSETARHINRRIALNIIRRDALMSRAELARRSGLQRSTISAIVRELIAEGIADAQRHLDFDVVLAEVLGILTNPR